MRFLGIDFGMKRVGVSITDISGDFALPLDVFANDKNLLDKILEICLKEGIEGIVMGESKDFSLNENILMESIKNFSAQLEEKTKIPVYFEPEFLTSAEAERLQGKNLKHDASAAAIILKSFLDKRKNNLQ